MGARGRRVLGLLLLAVCLNMPAGLAESRAAPSETSSLGLSCGETLTVWRKAKDPAARECCAVLVRARASLWARPARSGELAAEAQGLCPASLEAAVTLATSVLLQGRASEADQLFERARAGASAATWARLGALDRLLAARAAGISGARNRALDQYRSVILDLDHISSSHERARVLLEGALLAARATPPQLAEAQAYLRQSGDQLAPRLAVVRRLVGRMIEGPSAGDARNVREAAEEDSDQVLWMQEAGGRGSLAAPGELLPAAPSEVLRELLSGSRAAEGDAAETVELEALP